MYTELLEVYTRHFTPVSASGAGTGQPPAAALPSADVSSCCSRAALAVGLSARRLSARALAAFASPPAAAAAAGSGDAMAMADRKPISEPRKPASSM